MVEPAAEPTGPEGAPSATARRAAVNAAFVLPSEGPAMRSDLEELLRSTWADGAASFDETRRWLGRAPRVTTLRLNRAGLTQEAALEEARRFLGEARFARPEAHPILNDVLVLTPEERPEVQPLHPVLLVDAACGDAVLRGSDVFAPGVIALSESVSRKQAGQRSRSSEQLPALKVGDQVSIMAYVGSACRMTRGTYLDDVPAQLPSGSAVFVGNGTLAMPPHQIFREGHGVAVQNTDGFMERVDMQSLPPCFFAQNLPSAAVAHVLDAQPGERILDACAAPGGKTTHILTRMHWEGYVLAMDKSRKRAEGLALNVASARQGVGDADACEVICGDAVRGEWRCRHGGAQEMAEYFDRALCDAPCSASGLRPRLRFSDLGTKEVLDMAKYQRRVLKAITKVVRVGGVIVFSTCSLTAQENEENVRWALDELPLRLLAPRPELLRLVTPPSGHACTVLSDEERSRVMRFSAAGPGGVGFFVAKFEKV